MFWSGVIYMLVQENCSKERREQNGEKIIVRNKCLAFTTMKMFNKDFTLYTQPFLVVVVEICSQNKM